MGQTRLPSGWDEERMQKVLAHYEEQTEDEAARGIVEFDQEAEQ